MFRVYGFLWDPPQTSFPVLDWRPPVYSDPDLFGGGGGEKGEGIKEGTTIGVIKGDTRSLDNGSYTCGHVPYEL